MIVFQAFLFSLLCGLSYASHREPRSGYPTECCICDDHSSDHTKRCSTPGVCSRSFKLCTEYCHTTRHFHSGKWKTVRDCATRLTCINEWYRTVTTLGCIDNTRGEPASGTECHSCCRTPSPLKPHYCQEDPDTHFIRFNITTLPPTTTSTTTTTKTTPTTTPTPTTTTTIPTTTKTPGALCEVCTSNCTNPQTVSCPHGEDMCMTTVTTRDNGETSIKKECSTETQCYYDAYVFMKNVTDCQQAKQSGTFNKKGICHYCCKPGTGNQACNRGVIPHNIYTYENPNATHCMVGRDGSYTRTECKAATPSCMNTVIRSNGVTIVKKSCEDEIICDTDWWRNSRTRPECRSTDYQALNQSQQTTGVVCHYCCTSMNGSTCNTDDIPKDAMSKFKVDGSWGAWQAWAGCSPTCQGARIRIRTCSNPYPANGGSICQGSGYQQEVCPQNCHGPGIAIVG